MSRKHEIKFSGNLSQNVPKNILDAVPDVPNVLLKSKYFGSEDLEIADVQKANQDTGTSIEDKAALCFPVNSVWQRKAFEQRLTEFSIAHKFFWQCSSNKSFQCKKYGKPRITKKKIPDITNSVKCDCKWAITTCNLWTYEPDEKGNRRKWTESNPKKQETDAMYIVVTKLPEQAHNHELTTEVYQDTIQKCGIISREINSDSQMVRSCLLHLHSKSSLTNDTIKTLGAVSAPKFYAWNNQRCSNWRKKMVRLYNIMTPQEIITQKEFEASFMSDRIQKIFKDDLGDAKYTDTVSQLAKKELMTFYNESFKKIDNDEQLPKIETWFRRMKEMDPCFDYQMMNNSSHEIIGVVWMTGQMRRDLEEYGSYLMLDFMKKELNTSLFPYSAIVMFHPNGKLCLGSEAILLNESIETYKFLCDATFQMAFSRSKESVFVIAGDEFLNQEKVNTDLGFTHARFMCDQFHLIEVNLCNKFSGTSHFETLKTSIYKWINAATKNEFDAYYSELLRRMESNNCNAYQMNAVQDLMNKKDHFAIYRLRSYKGTLNRKGNPGSESNHASVSSYLDSTALLEIPQMHAMLSERQLYWNHSMKIKYQNEERELRYENSQTGEQILKDASSCVDNYSLVLSGYKLLKEQCMMSLNLNILESNVSNGCITFDDGIVLNANEACQCEYRQADMIQCCHEIKRSGTYDMSCFDRRYIYHKRPWDRRIPRNGVDVSDDFTKNTSDEPMKQMTKIQSKSSESDDDNIVSSVTETRNFTYASMMPMFKEVAGNIDSNCSYSFKKKACAAVYGIGQLAKYGAHEVNTNLNEIFSSFVLSEKEKTRSPPRKSNSYQIKTSRIPFRSEVRRNGSAGIGKGTRRSLNTLDPSRDFFNKKNQKPTCTFCNSYGCSVKKARNCKKLLDYGGEVIARFNNQTKDGANEMLLFTVRNGNICPASDAIKAPEGIANRGSKKHAKHFILHSLHLKRGINELTGDYDLDNIEVLVTALDKDGNINTTCEKKLIPCYDFISLIQHRAEKTRFIIDRRKFDEIGARKRKRQNDEQRKMPSSSVSYYENMPASVLADTQETLLTHSIANFQIPQKLDNRMRYNTAYDTGTQFYSSTQQQVIQPMSYLPNHTHHWLPAQSGSQMEHSYQNIPGTRQSSKADVNLQLFSNSQSTDNHEDVQQED